MDIISEGVILYVFIPRYHFHVMEICLDTYSLVFGNCFFEIVNGFLRRMIIQFFIMVKQKSVSEHQTPKDFKCSCINMANILKLSKLISGC